jgi:hypothetical protein
MGAAQLATTSSDVSAFSIEHVADRAQKRRDAIDHALAASADRVRTEAMRAEMPTHPAPPTQPLQGPLHDGAFRAQAPATPGASEPPAGVGTYSTTLGSAALDASAALPNAPRVHRHAPTVAAFLFGFAVVMGASITILHPKWPTRGHPAAAGARAKAIGPTMPGAALPGVPAPSGAASGVPMVAGSNVPAVDAAAAGGTKQWVAPEKRSTK